MKIKAAVLRGVGQGFEVAELELDPPRPVRRSSGTWRPACATPMSICVKGISRRDVRSSAGTKVPGSSSMRQAPRVTADAMRAFRIPGPRKLFVLVPVRPD